MLTHSMRHAENLFHAGHEKEISADRDKLEQLEETHKARASPQYNGTAEARAARAEIAELKERLSRPVFVNYRDWGADKATLLELLSKSKFRAMSYTDEMGIRAHGYTLNKFLSANLLRKDLGLLTLAGDGSSDSVLIRSSASGGANLMSVRGDSPVRFNLMSLTDTRDIGRIRKRLDEAGPCRGITLLIQGTDRAASESAAAGMPGPDHIARAIGKVFATEDPEHRITVRLSPGWDKFLACDPSLFPVRDSEAARDAMDDALCSLRTLVHSAMRAALTRRIYLDLPDLGGASDPDREVTLTQDDLTLAHGWVLALFDGVFGIKHLQVRAENATKAREAKSLPWDGERLALVRDRLEELIRSDPDGWVPRTTALRTDGITARGLDAVLEAFPEIFEIRTGLKRPGNNTPVKQAIALRPQAPAASGPVGGEPSPHPGGEIPASVVNETFLRLQREAGLNYHVIGGKPAVAIDANAATPAFVAVALAVQRRYWQTTTILPSGPGVPGTSTPSRELWFRLDSKGREMCDWNESFTEWNLARKWQDKDEAAAEERAAQAEQEDGCAPS